MESVIVSSEEEIVTAVEEHDKRGLRCAAMSNTGLPPGQMRLTFIPVDAFGNAKKPTMKDEEIRKLIARLVDLSVSDDAARFNAAVALKSLLQEREAERERVKAAFACEAFWRLQGATPDANTQSAEAIYRQNETYERRLLEYLCDELVEEVEPLSDLQKATCRRYLYEIRRESKETTHEG
jgi:hypothetical protein